MTRREWLALTAAAPLSAAAAPQIPAPPEFQCEDLPNGGLRLIPSSSPEYKPLLDDILARQAHPVEGGPPIPENMRPKIYGADRSTSAILVNRSQKAVAGLEFVWTFERAGGGSYSHSTESSARLLLPYNIPEAMLKQDAYWRTIMPGSKRYLGGDKIIGDNTDIRPPADDEKYHGGGFSGGVGGGANNQSPFPIRRITLTLDGVFFDDGEFLGPNNRGLWERTVSDAQAHTEIAKIAREGLDKGTSAGKILAAIGQWTGPAPSRPPMPPGMRSKVSMEEYHASALQKLAFQFDGQHTHFSMSDERIVEMIAAWSTAKVPNFHKS